MKKLILASNSPRRKEIFTKMGFDFLVMPSDKEPHIDINADAINSALNSAKIKAEDIFSRNQDDVVVGADTVVSVDSKVLGKPKDRDDAFNMLKMLSNKKHQVITAVYVCSPKKSKGFVNVTDVEFYDLDDNEINAYIDTNECMDKAGSYAIQGKGFRLVKAIHGDYNNVVGFPAAEFLRFLKKENIEI